jgi:hypothetical protein
LLHQMLRVSCIRHYTANQTSLSCREMYCFVFKWYRVQIFTWIWATSAYSFLHVSQSFRQLTGHGIKLGQECFFPQIGVTWGRKGERIKPTVVFEKSDASIPLPIQHRFSEFPCL